MKRHMSQPVATMLVPKPRSAMRCARAGQQRSSRRSSTASCATLPTRLFRYACGARCSQTVASMKNAASSDMYNRNSAERKFIDCV